MSDRGKYNNGVRGTYFSPGQWNAICQRCGRKYKSSYLQEEWDGLRVCRECFEDRHPQDMVRGVTDKQSVPWSSPEQPDNFLLDATITGLTQAPFAPGSEVVWDETNTLQVMVTGGTLSSDTDLNVMNGSNLCAVMNVSGSWEILQFGVAQLTGVATYTLSHLLRARYETEVAMNFGVLPANSPFVFIGQASPSNDIWIQNYLNWLLLPVSPVYVGGYNDNGDQIFVWERRSRFPYLWEDDWNGRNGTNYFAPIDTQSQLFEVDILSNGSVIRTLPLTSSRLAAYPLGLQIEDFGSVQSSYSIVVYQVDPILGRGSGRPATVPVILGTANDTLVDNYGNLLFDNHGTRLIG